MIQGQAAILRRAGSPPELAVEPIAVADPADDQLLVRMAFAPINPADLNVLEGRYPRSPALPGIPGNEGIGQVIAVGPAATVAIGEQIIAPGTIGSWASHRLLRSPQVITLPPGMDPRQGAMLTVNPATACRLLADFAPLAAGDWILLNAANSGVGRWLIQLAAMRGLRVGAVVRRPELIPELMALGATVVVTEDGNPEQLRSTMGGSLARLAVNMVGGDSAAGLLRGLAAGGTLVTCGAMGLAPVTVGNAALIFRNITVRGYWHSAAIEADWADGGGTRAPAVRAMYLHLAALLPRFAPHPIAAVYPLTGLAAALAAAATPTRPGRILLHC